MKLSPQWIRDFVDLPVDDHRLAEDLTAVGIAVEGISGSGEETTFEMEIGTNRPDAMNHYGVAREAAAIYDVGLKPLKILGLGSLGAAEVKPFPITVEEPALCPRFSARVIPRRRLRIVCSCWISGPSATPSMPRIMFCGKWASPPTSSIWICLRAGS
jgi:phenylalanyl-tRNA synthetase beta chain